MNDVKNYYIKGSNPDFNSHSIQAKYMEIILTVQNVNLVDISGTKGGNIQNIQLVSLHQTARTRTVEAYGEA
jgi:hypothetical protein